MAKYQRVCTLLEGKGGRTHCSACECTYHLESFFFFITVDVLDEEKFNVELIVQCIRVSEMPQTHHHALLLLGTVAGIFPVSIKFETSADILGIFFLQWK